MDTDMDMGGNESTSASNFKLVCCGLIKKRHGRSLVIILKKTKLASNKMMSNHNLYFNMGYDYNIIVTSPSSVEAPSHSPITVLAQLTPEEEMLMFFSSENYFSHQNLILRLKKIPRYLK